MFESPIYCLQTFGCKSNQYESQGIREILNTAGMRETSHPAEAGIYIVNSCGVTGRASASCRNAVRKALRANPSIKVVLTGCGVDLDESWPEIASGPPLLVPNAKKYALPALIATWLGNRRTEPALTPAGRFGLSISSFQGHTRAFLKIQDGCDNHCAYCAVPRARGIPESRPAREVLAEAKRLVENGHREIVLTGINIGVYREGTREFADLVSEIAAIPGLARLRLGSVEPPQVTERLVRIMAGQPSICPHIHIPLQSGDDLVLSRMGRRYTASEFLDKATMLREYLPFPAITTDIIVGFPGEDESAFEASEELCGRAGFSRLHVFLFSPRPGTPAAKMKRTLPEREIERWKTRLIRTGERLSIKFAEGCVGMSERVIVEKSGVGLSDRYLGVIIKGGARTGDVLRVEIIATNRGKLEGKRESIIQFD